VIARTVTVGKLAGAPGAWVAQRAEKSWVQSSVASVVGTVRIQAQSSHWFLLNRYRKETSRWSWVVPDNEKVNVMPSGWRVPGTSQT